MDNFGYSLLPIIMDFLSRRGKVTKDLLFTAMVNTIPQDEAMSYSAFRNAFDNALEIGSQMGIVNISNNNVRVPFNFQYYQIKDDEVSEFNVEKSTIGRKRKMGRGRQPVKQAPNHRQVTKSKKARAARVQKLKPINKAMKRYRYKCTCCLRCAFCCH